jgi:hypothetical protein
MDDNRAWIEGVTIVSAIVSLMRLRVSWFTASSLRIRAEQ